MARLGPGDSALDAARLMTAEGVGSVLVSDASGATLGIFTERDLMLLISKGELPRDVPIEEVMTKDLYSTGPERGIVEVRREMQARHIRHLPVEVDGQIVAVLSIRDLFRADLREKRRDVEAMQAYIRGDEYPSPAPEEGERGS